MVTAMLGGEVSQALRNLQALEVKTTDLQLKTLEPQTQEPQSPGISGVPLSQARGFQGGDRRL